MNNCIITIDDCTPVITESKLMPCQSCGMYQYFSLSVINSYNQVNTSGYGMNSFTYSCNNCYEKFALAQQINDLQLTILRLRERVTSLVNLREAENSFDNTVMSALVNQFANLDTNMNTSVPQPAQQEIIGPVSQSESLSFTPSDTSVWVSDSNRDNADLSVHKSCCILNQ